MKLALSGYAGVGKSSLIEKVRSKYENIMIFPESAREVNETKDFFSLSDKNNDFFQKSVMDNEIIKITLAHENKIENAIFDRTIIDNFTFAELYYGKNRVNFDKFDKFINNFKEKHEIEYIYDSIILIKSTRDKNYINNVILKDDFRKKTTSENANNFILKAQEWEDNYLNLYSKMKISKNLKIVEHFIENKYFDDEMDDILKYSFLNI